MRIVVFSIIFPQLDRATLLFDINWNWKTSTKTTCDLYYLRRWSFTYCLSAIYETFAHLLVCRFKNIYCCCYEKMAFLSLASKDWPHYATCLHWIISKLFTSEKNLLQINIYSKRNVIRWHEHLNWPSFWANLFS